MNYDAELHRYFEALELFLHTAKFSLNFLWVCAFGIFTDYNLGKIMMLKEQVFLNVRSNLLRIEEIAWGENTCNDLYLRVNLFHEDWDNFFVRRPLDEKADFH